MAIVISDTSPAGLLKRYHGRVTVAARAYPDAIHLDLIDDEGGLWGLGTWDATYAPSDLTDLLGKTVRSADLDGRTGVLRLRFEDETSFEVTPATPVDDEIENWELFTPDGLVLTYGPKGRWQLGNASDPC